MVLVSHRPEMLGISQYGIPKYETEDKVFWHFLKIRDGDPFLTIMDNNLKYNTITET
jgi:hypothetical protein